MKNTVKEEKTIVRKRKINEEKEKYVTMEEEGKIDNVIKRRYKWRHRNNLERGQQVMKKKEKNIYGKKRDKRKKKKKKKKNEVNTKRRRITLMTPIDGETKPKKKKKKKKERKKEREKD